MLRQNFYGTDLERVKALWGSRDYDFVKNILDAERENFTDIVEFFEGDVDDFTMSSVEDRLRDIVDGSVKKTGNSEDWVYVRVLDVICMHIGKAKLGPEDYMIGDWDGTPIESIIDAPALEGSGPPLPVPYSTEWGTSFDHIALEDIPDEIRHIDDMPAAYEARQQGFVPRMLRKLFGGEIRKLQDSPDWKVALEYRAILQEALDKQVSLIADAG